MTFKHNGRTKGAKTILTSEIKELILEALDREGGVDYLQRQAQENPKAFISLLARIIPQEIKQENTHTFVPTPELLAAGREELKRIASKL